MAKPDGYDVVVVGGGAAGCVVAARLSEARARSVLLLEAGPDLRANPPHLIRNGWAMIGRQFDWGDASEPDELGTAHQPRRVRILGGTSSITRFALRGSPGDYDEWEALGNPGWGFADVLPYFRRIESDLDFGDTPWHGTGGPIPVTRYRDVEPTEIHAAVLRGLEAAGFPSVDDHNRPDAVGAGRMPMSSRDGVRTTTALAYLPIGGTPPNLTIRCDAQVSEIVFEGMRATGVRLLEGTVIAAGGVVLSAGTFGSPPILMRSGIGPAEHLRSAGISVRLDLPGVGANLADHPDVDIDTGYRGPARQAPRLHSVATFHSRDASTNAPPDLLLWTYDPALPGGALQVAVDVVLVKPRSRGSVRLRSANPGDLPRIVLPGLREPSDLERLCEAYRRGWEVANYPAVRRLCSQPLARALPDDDALRDSIRRTATSIPHYVGTCAMGPSPRNGAVVDGAGRVHGTEALFVADASVMPTVPSGFTHIPTIMIAERLAEHIAQLL